MSEIQHNSPPALAGGAGGGSSSAAKEERALARSLHPQPLPEVREGRNDWTRGEIRALFDLPFLDLLYEAQTAHRRFHAPNEVQLSTLLSIKTGGCPEDCGYCSQSAFAKTGLKAEKLMDADAVLAAAAEAKAAGSGRFCMGAAWREPKDRDMDALCTMVAGVKAMGLETSMT